MQGWKIVKVLIFKVVSFNFLWRILNSPTIPLLAFHWICWCWWHLQQNKRIFHNNDIYTKMFSRLGLGFRRFCSRFFYPFSSDWRCFSNYHGIPTYSFFEFVKCHFSIVPAISWNHFNNFKSSKTKSATVCNTHIERSFVQNKIQ